MAWRAISEVDLLQRMSSTELEAIRESGLSDSQGDPVADTIDQVTELVRGYIAANRNNKLGTAGTLPERLIRSACDILVVDVSTRVGGVLIDLSETRKDAKRDAIRLLEQVAAGTYAIEEPDTEGDDSQAAPTPSLYDKTRYFKRCDQEGI